MARAEGGAVGGQDDDAYGIIGRCLFEHLVQVDHHGVGQGIASGDVVQRQAQDAVLDVFLQDHRVLFYVLL